MDEPNTDVIQDTLDMLILKTLSLGRNLRCHILLGFATDSRDRNTARVGCSSAEPHADVCASRTGSVRCGSSVWLDRSVGPGTPDEIGAR